MSPERLLVLHAGALGDFILALHLVARFRAAAPRRVALAARSSWVRWAVEQGHAEEGCSLDQLSLTGLYQRPPVRDSALRSVLDRTDVVVSLLGDEREPANSALRDMGCPIVGIDPRPSHRTLADGTHIVDQWSAQLADAGWTLDARAQAPMPPMRRIVGERRGPQQGGQPEEGPRTMTRENRPAKVIIHPGSGSLTKCCPLEALMALSARIDTQGYRVCWMIGPDEVERFGMAWASRLGGGAEIVISTSARDATAALESASLYVGMDAGMTHVAALTGLPTIAIFGPTDARVWRPIGEQVTVVPFPRAGEEPTAWAAQVARGRFG